MQTVPFKNKRGDVPVSLYMLSDTGANGKDTVDIHAYTSGSRAEHVPESVSQLSAPPSSLPCRLHRRFRPAVWRRVRSRSHHPENHGQPAVRRYGNREGERGYLSRGSRLCSVLHPAKGP